MSVRCLIFATAVVVAALAAPPAHADDPDPHNPNGAAGYCPGGIAEINMQGGCMGEPYPDGTRYIEAFYADSPNPFMGPYWHRTCTYDSRDGAKYDFMYARDHGCGRG